MVGDLIGRGISSRVFRGLKTDSGEVVAIKAIKKSSIEQSRLSAIQVCYCFKRINVFNRKNSTFSNS